MREAKAPSRPCVPKLMVSPDPSSVDDHRKSLVARQLPQISKFKSIIYVSSYAESPVLPRKLVIRMRPRYDLLVNLADRGIERRVSELAVRTEKLPTSFVEL